MKGSFIFQKWIFEETGYIDWAVRFMVEVIQLQTI